MNKSIAPQAVSQSVLSTIRRMFDNHRSIVRRVNEEKKERAGIKPDKAEQQFLTGCSTLHSQLGTVKSNADNLLKDLQNNDKTRREKKKSYVDKLVELNRALENIQKRKFLNIKINGFVAELPDKTTEMVARAIDLQASYLKAGVFSCGSDTKGLFEVQMNNITDKACLLGNLLNLESKTGENSVVEYLPVEFEERQFSGLQQQIEKVWPQPVIIERQSKVAAPVVVPLPPVQQKVVTEVRHIVEEDRLRLAHELLFGFTRPQDISQALKIYEQESTKENPNALNSLGTIYEEGRFAPKNLKKAIAFFLKSAQKSNPEGLYKVGQFLEKGLVKTKELFSGLYHNRESEVRGAIGYLQKAAKEGHLDAITDLGYIYEKGIKSEDQEDKYYIEPHLEFAEKYYIKAKKQNFPRSYNNLGVFYLNNPGFGEVVEGDNTRRAIKYLEKAVQLGYLKAYLNLGKCYENGQGVEKNMDRARSLYQQGAKKGDTDCKLAYVLTIIRDELSDDRRMSESADILREILALDKDNDEAKFYLGLFCEKGIGITKDEQAAFRYVESAAKNNYAPAINKLGDFYYSGFACKRDPETALMLYEKAASEGYLQSLVNMGILYEEGYVPSGGSVQKAIECYQQAANGGNPNGYVNLGLLTMNRNSQEQSQFFLKKAAQLGNIYAMQVLAHKTMKPPLVVNKTHSMAYKENGMNANHEVRTFSSDFKSKTKSFRKSQAPNSQQNLDPYA